MPIIKKRKNQKSGSKARPNVNSYLARLGAHGYFAWQCVMGDVAFIFAMKGGKPLAICTGKGSHTAGSATIKDFEKAGGRSFCVSSLDDLERNLTNGAL